MSRWPETARSFTVTPARQRSLPFETYVSVETGSTWARSRRQAISRSSDCTAAAGGFAVWKLPISAIPTLPVLNPSACAPITLRVMPPYRPS